jgi:hypothetical protein
MRLFLLLLLGFVVSTTLICGLAMMTSPDGSTLSLPAALLGPTPFKNFFIPGLILAGIVGGVSMIALYFTFTHQPNRYNWSVAAGLILCGWIIGQVILIGAANWLHVAYFVAGLLIFLLSWRLKGKWAI